MELTVSSIRAYALYFILRIYRRRMVCAGLFEGFHFYSKLGIDLLSANHLHHAFASVAPFLHIPLAVEINFRGYKIVASTHLPSEYVHHRREFI